MVDNPGMYRTASGRPKHVNPNGPQAQLLDELERRVNDMPAVFEQAQRNRDIHQKRLNEMFDGTRGQIDVTQAHIQMKAKHVRDTTALYNAKFERELSICKVDLRRDLVERLTKMEEAIDQLEVGMSNVEADVIKQRESRQAEVSCILGPIVAEVQEITDLLDSEKRDRKKQEAAREKLLADHLEAYSQLMEQEKHDREMQHADFTRWQNEQKNRLAKHQYQVEQETRETAAGLRHELEAVAKERISCQSGVIESIASFIKTYREQVSKEMALG